MQKMTDMDSNHATMTTSYHAGLSALLSFLFLLSSVPSRLFNVTE